MLMNMKKIIGLVLAVWVSGQCMAAAVNPGDTIRYNGLSRCEDNWFVELSVGGNVSFSKDSRLNYGFRNLMPNIAVSGGKWFSPFVGVRLQLQGYGTAAGSTVAGAYLADPLPGGGFGSNDPVRDHVKIRPDGSYTYPVYFVNVHADVMLSVMSLVNKGMGMLDRWDVIPAVGIGYMHVFSKDGVPASDVLAGSFSVMGKYRVLPFLDVNVEVQSILMPDMYEGRLTGAMADNMFTFNVGVTYNIGGHRFSGRDRIPERNSRNERKPRSERIAQPHYPAITDSVLLRKMDDLDRRMEALDRRMEALAQERETEGGMIVVQGGDLSASDLQGKVIGTVLYRIGSAKPSSSPRPQLENVLAMLKAFPDAKVCVEGYADGETGSEERNLELSRQRAEHVRDLLVEECGIPENRVETKAFGATRSPYKGEADLQRAVVFRLVF